MMLGLILIMILLTVLTVLIVLLKIKSYIQNNNLSTFNNRLLDAKTIFLNELLATESNKVRYNFTVETLLNTLDYGCYFYYKNHYNKYDFLKLHKEDIIKHYKRKYSNDSEDSDEEMALKYPYLSQFVLENDL